MSWFTAWFGYGLGKAAGESLFGPRDLGMQQAARDMELDEDELNDLMRQPS